MEFYKVKNNKNFIGREFQYNQLNDIYNNHCPSIVVMYGRRRIGKTELLEQTFQDKKIIKLEGVEGLDEKEQIKALLLQFSKYLNDKNYANLQISNWHEFLDLVYEKTKKLKIILYFEEVQWIANYSHNFIAHLKNIWDNNFSKNTNSIIILCGSSPSYIINNIIKSKSLYNRSQFEFCLYPLSFAESSLMLKNKSLEEKLLAYLIVGGIPEYLKRLKQKSSVLLSICTESFMQNSFFYNEYDKIFTSALSNNKNYKKIIEFLSKKKFATRNEISKYLKLSSGGTLSNLLTDLEVSDFIEKYVPYNLSENSLLARYCVKDNFLHFYFKYIKTLQKKIKMGDYNDNPISAINMTNLQKWLGFAFERFCRSNHKIIAQKLGFSGVKYNHGVFFDKATNKEAPGYQIDLIFDREDKVITICEIKYHINKISPKIIKDFEQKLELFPNKNKKTIQKILISLHGPDQQLYNKHYFDSYITLNDFAKNIDIL